MRIYVMRHGQTLQNARHQCQGGCSDSSLTKRGIEKTLNAKEVIDSLGIERIYSGDLGRQLQTVSLVNTNNIEHIIDPNLNETLLGWYENKPIIFMYLKPILKTGFYGSAKDLSINFIMDGLSKADETGITESSKEVLVRVDKAMSKITNCGLDNVLIISSGMFLETLISKYNPDIKFMRMKNCGIYMLDSEDNYKVSTIYE